MTTSETANPTEIIEARRAARKAALADQRNAQLAIDLEAIDALEVELGDSNIAVIDIPYTPGLPTCMAVRCPNGPEAKRYKSRIKGAAQNKEVDGIGAAEDVGLVCVVYPDKETTAQLVAARPTVLTDCGVAALKMSGGKAVEAGKS